MDADRQFKSGEIKIKSTMQQNVRLLRIAKKAAMIVGFVFLLWLFGLLNILSQLGGIWSVLRFVVAVLILSIIIKVTMNGKTESPPSLTTANDDLKADQTTAKQNDTTEKSFSSITDVQPQVEIELSKSQVVDNVQSNDVQSKKSHVVDVGSTEWKWIVAFLLGLVVVSWIATLFIGQHNYIVEDGGEYGYKDDLTKHEKENGVNKPLRFFSYAGVYNGKHQVYVDNYLNLITALECAVPCKAIKEMTFLPDFSFRRKTFISLDSDSVEVRVMEDAINGHLKVHGLKYYNVSVEEEKKAVPTRPLFSEDGITFEYYEEQ